jgi:NAD(P)-dependent dehydrogenase (short-subunit alcohol dehydrogenase family)
MTMTSIFITGIARGIGFELARQALDKGWQVAGSVRSARDGQRLAKLLPAVNVLEFDVTDFDAVDQAAATLSSPIDILINNAGVIGPARQSTTDMDFDGFAKTLQINSLAPLKVSQAFLPHLRKGKRARLVTISLRQSMLLYKSDFLAIIDSPISIVFLLLTLIIMIRASILGIRNGRS